MIVKGKDEYYTIVTQLPFRVAVVQPGFSPCPDCNGPAVATFDVEERVSSSGMEFIHEPDCKKLFCEHGVYAVQPDGTWDPDCNLCEHGNWPETDDDV